MRFVLHLFGGNGLLIYLLLLTLILYKVSPHLFFVLLLMSRKHVDERLLNNLKGYEAASA